MPTPIQELVLISPHEEDLSLLQNSLSGSEWSIQWAPTRQAALDLADRPPDFRRRPVGTRVDRVRPQPLFGRAPIGFRKLQPGQALPIPRDAACADRRVEQAIALTRL